MLAAGSEVVPLDVTQAVMDGESAAIAAWADRHQWSIDSASDGSALIARASHPVTGNHVDFHADLTGYPAVPPAWTCQDEAGASGSRAYPAPGTTPAITGSIFHTLPVICAPWNRLAYVVHNGPHSDWGAPTEWKTAGPSYTQAHTIADMLAALRLHLLVSPGMQP